MECTSKCSKMTGIMKHLVVLGALNWGLVGIGDLFGLGNWNVINIIFGSISWLEGVIYILIGLSAVMTLKACRGKCNRGAKTETAPDMSDMNHSDMDHHKG